MWVAVEFERSRRFASDRILLSVRVGDYARSGNL